MKTKHLAPLTLIMLITAAAVAADTWKAKLQNELPLLGHRNWIVVVDSAYPLQTAPGIETICADQNQLEVVKDVLGGAS